MKAMDARPAAEHDDYFTEKRERFTLDRLRWLVRLRWVALAGILLATVLAVAGAFPGVAWQVLAGVCVAGGLYNLALLRKYAGDGSSAGRRAAMFQALVDILILTVALWAAGGVQSPFLGFYVFHVALVGILVGPRATYGAAAVAGVCVGVLALADFLPWMQIGIWDPVPPWDFLADVTAFVATAGGVAYIVTHAMRELRDREMALARARDRAAIEYQLLSHTLNELEAGLEVVDHEGNVLWRNRRAELLSPMIEEHVWQCPGAVRACEKDVTGVCPMITARSEGGTGRCRFAAQIDADERVYEMMSFPLSIERGEPPRVMNLYLDRTEATLDERRLVLAERLVSLGRVAQGVAHELNTPLATIRTLAADMRVALRGLDESDDPSHENGTDRGRVLDDVDESAGLIQDETRRLGRITQALLAGGDLVRAHMEGTVPLGAVVERARALVFAGVRNGPAVHVDAAVGSLSVSADPDRLMQVLVNLLQNAHDAVRDRPGRVMIAARADGDHVRLTVDDDGPGIAEAIEGRLFEPFTTTKPPGQGTGLGLYTSYMLAQAMGGTLSLERREEGGTRATIRLPAAESESLSQISGLHRPH
jgi:signal transduction histidine kinase